MKKIGNREFVKLSRYLFGGSWHRSLSSESGISKQAIERVAYGIDPVSDEMILALEKAYRKRISGLRARLFEMESQ